MKKWLEVISIDLFEVHLLERHSIRLLEFSLYLNPFSFCFKLFTAVINNRDRCLFMLSVDKGNVDILDLLWVHILDRSAGD